MELKDFLLKNETHSFFGVTYDQDLELIYDMFVVPYRLGKFDLNNLKKYYHHEICYDFSLDFFISLMKKQGELKYQIPTRISMCHTYMTTLTKKYPELFSILNKKFDVRVSNELPSGVMLFDRHSVIESKMYMHDRPFFVNGNRYSIHPNIEQYGFWIIDSSYNDYTNVQKYKL